jgi:hypothetical protein
LDERCLNGTAETSEMRRNAIAVLLFALALGLKALLPAAMLADSARHGPQLSAFQDCLSAAAEGALGQAQTPGKAERHAANCPLCQISCDGSFALPGRAPQPASLAFFTHAAPFETAARAEPRARPAAAHQPRAPPLFS